MKVNIISSEGISMQIDYKNAIKSKLIKETLEESGVNPEDEDSNNPEEIPVPIEAEVLKDIIEFINHDEILGEIDKPIKTTDMYDMGIPKWYVDFVYKNTTQHNRKLITKANYLDLGDLLELLSCYFAVILKKASSIEEYKEILGVPTESTESTSTEESENHNSIPITQDLD